MSAIKANTKVTFHLSGSGQPGSGVVLTDEVDGYQTVAVDSLFGEKPQPDGVRSIYNFPSGLLKEAATIATGGVTALILAFLLLAGSFALQAQTYQTPISGVPIYGTNFYNLPGLQPLGTNVPNGTVGYVNTNYQSAPVFTAKGVNKLTLALSVLSQPNTTNYTTTSFGLVESLDNVHWFTPSTVGGAYPGPNSLLVTNAYNTTNSSVLAAVAATNFDSYGVLYFAIPAVTNANNSLTNSITNTVTITVYGKQGL